jgi:hypothetical protein
LNERIEKLANIWANRRGQDEALGITYTFSEQALARFAELIVRECVSIVDDAERGGSNEIWDNAVKFVRRDLKEHFGVEE